MAKSNNSGMYSGDGELPSTSTASNRRILRSKPYDPNNSFVKKVASKVTDLIPQSSWISKWFNNSQEDIEYQFNEPETSNNEIFDESQMEPAHKRPCIRMDVTHPPGTFDIKPRIRNQTSEALGSMKMQYGNHNETNFLEPVLSGTKIHGLVASTPAIQNNANKMPDSRSSMNLLVADQNNIAHNADDNSESSESTSGCSSLVPQNTRQEAPANTNYSLPFANKKRYCEDKLNFTNHLQSSRTFLLDNSNRDSLSSRRPSFNASMVNTSLDRSLNSPFYTGNTMFGGANAANLYKKGSSVLAEAGQCLKNQIKVPKRTSVQVNPSNESSTSDLSGMSHTAKRILEALEQFSSPISDAKKIPLRYTGSNLSPTVNRKRCREDDSASTSKVGLRHLAKELTVPTVPDLLRIRRRQRLQDTTIAARKIVTANNASTARSQEYQLRLENSPETKRNTELKAKKKNNLEEEETVQEVNLPSIPLPISSLPKFDIALPQQSKETAEKSDFKFASPIKLSDGSKDFKAISSFIFSNPISPSKNTVETHSELNKTLSIQSNNSSFNAVASTFTNFVYNKPTESIKLKEKETTSNIPKVANELKAGSVLDVLNKSPVKNLTNVWECSECLIKNHNNETKCIACRTIKPTKQDNTSTKLQFNKQEVPIVSPKSKADDAPIINKNITTEKTSLSSPKSTIPSTFVTKKSTQVETEPVNQLKTSKKSWECPCCMVSNADKVLTCPCCNTKKPGTFNTSPKIALEAATIVSSSFGDKFKKPEGSWTCETCLLQNKSDVNKCVACEAPKSTKKAVAETPAFGDKFKKPEGTWTCDTCMITNKSDILQCAACETPKPGIEEKRTANNTPKLQFKVDMPENSSKFQFGIDKAQVQSKTDTILPKSNGFMFGNNTNQSLSPATFTFGASSTDSKTEESPKSSVFNFKPDTSVATYQFGSKPIETVQSSPNVSKIPEKPNVTPSSIFGNPNTETKSQNFVFGTPKTSSTSEVENETVKNDKLKKDTPETKSTKNLNKENSVSQINEITDSAKEENKTEEIQVVEDDTDDDDIQIILNSPIKAESKTSKTFYSTSKSNTNSMFSFGNTQTKLTSNTSSVVTTSNAAVSKPTMFTFSGATNSETKEKQSLPAFSTITSSTTSSVFSFGTNKVSDSKNTISTFGNNSATFNNADKTPVPSLFGNIKPTTASDSNEKPSLFSASENKIPNFGETEKKIPTFSSLDKPVITFPAKTQASSVFPSSAFGTASPSPSPFDSTPNVFGGITASAFGACNTSQNIFAETAKPTENAATTPGPFTFGSSSQTNPATPATGFNFSTNTNNIGGTEQKNLFTFNSNVNNNGQPGSGFGSSSSFNAQSNTNSTSSFTFNAPKTEVPTFGQTSSSAPMFNAPASTPTFPSPAASSNPGFNFQSPSVPNNFSFGTSAQPSPGGFNFGTPANAGSNNAFDPTSTPSFNFTGGAATEFKAAPSVVQERKFKKAVRRMR